MRSHAPSEVGFMVNKWQEYLETNIGLRVPDNEAYSAYNFSLDEIKKISHKTDRDKGEIARQLDMNVSNFEELVKGKTVLDIGCGAGRLTEDIARLKKTYVTALDYDPEMLSRVPARSNITVVEGSGYKLDEALGDEAFDIVISSFSSVLWARSEAEKSSAIQGAYEKTAEGGKTLIVPILSNPMYRHQQAEAAVTHINRGNLPKEEGFHWAVTLQQVHVAGWLDLVALNALTNIQSSGGTLEYRANRANSANNPLQEHYSVIVSRSSEL